MNPLPKRSDWIRMAPGVPKHICFPTNALRLDLHSTQRSKTSWIPNKNGSARRQLLHEGCCTQAAAACRRLLHAGNCCMKAAAACRQLLHAGRCCIQAVATCSQLLRAGSCCVQAAAVCRQLLRAGSCCVQAAAAYARRRAAHAAGLRSTFSNIPFVIPLLTFA